MSVEFSNTKSVTIHAPASEVWRALIDPNLIKQYFFAVETTGDWREGNTIIYNGEWQGKKFEGKARVLQMEEQKLLRYRYWSNMSGIPDQPENYHIITYFLEKHDDATRLTMTEENLADKEMQDRSSKLWDMVFKTLQKLLEKESHAGMRR